MSLDLNFVVTEKIYFQKILHKYLAFNFWLFQSYQFVKFLGFGSDFLKLDFVFKSIFMRCE